MLNSQALKHLTIAGIFILAFTFGLREINQSGGGYPNFPDRVISANEENVSISTPTGATGTEIA